MELFTCLPGGGSSSEYENCSPASSVSFLEETISLEKPFLPLGSRHLDECDEEEFFTLLPSDSGCYELIDGLLRACPMVTGQHSLVVKNLSIYYHMRKHTRARSTSNPANVINEDFFLENCVVRINSKNSLCPDIVIGVPNYLEKTPFGESNIPKLVCEVTSHNRMTDLHGKEDFYGELGILTTLL